MIRINKVTIKQYLLIYLVIIFQGSVLFKNYQEILYVLVLIFGMGYLFLHNKLLRSDYMKYVYVLIVFLLMVSIISAGSLSIASICNIISRFILIYIAYQYDKEKFAEHLIKFITFISVISLIGFAVQRMNPSLLTSILPSVFSSNVEYFGGVLFTYSGLLHTKRNMGIMAEPGLFQIIVNVGIYLILFDKSINIRERKKHVYLTILLITIITIQSTSGYIGTLGLLILFLLDPKRKWNRRTIRKIALCLLAFGVFLVSVRGENNIIYENLVSKITDSDGNLNLAAKTGKSRILSMKADLEVMKDHPLGAGFETYIEEWSTHIPIVIGDDSSCVGVTKSLATLGIPVTALLLLFYLKWGLKNCNSVWGFISYLFLLFNSCLGQPLFYFPILMVIVLCPMKKDNSILQNQYDENMLGIQYSFLR